MVDRLLASDAYAERMTSEWLDVARYSDSNGYQRDHEHAFGHGGLGDSVFQENMRYDEFVTTQLAGDLFPDATQDQVWQQRLIDCMGISWKEESFQRNTE